MTLPEDVIETVARARSVCVLSGAGISAESGVPTFRGTDGLWSKFRPEELANVDAFLRNPQLVWEWYSYRRKIVADVQPNEGHRALVKLQHAVPIFTLVTQNVDGLHQRAGSTDVIELHGNIERSTCIECRTFAEKDDPAFGEGVPRCRHCGGLLRPDVVWFGELLPRRAFMEAEYAAEHCEVFLCVGTSGVVYPAALLPQTARAHGAYVLEINTEPTDLSAVVSRTILGKAGVVLPELMRAMQSRKKESP